MVMEDAASQSQSHSGFGELLHLLRQSSGDGVFLDDYSYNHDQGLWPCCYSPEAVDFYVATRARAASGRIIKCLRSNSDFSLPSKPESYCGIQQVLVQDPPRQKLAKKPVQVKDSTDAFLVRLAGRTQEIIRLPTEVRLNHLLFSSFTTTTSVSPHSFPTVSRTVSISEGSKLPKTLPNIESTQQLNDNNLHARSHRRAASDPVHINNPHFFETWPEKTHFSFPSIHRQQMVKKRRSLQAIFVPSFLQGGALSLSPTLISPTSPSLNPPPSPTPVTSPNSFKQRARAHSAAAGKAARVFGEEAKDAYVSLRSGFNSGAAMVSPPYSAGVVHDVPLIRPVSPPSPPSRRKPSISSIIQAIPSFSSGITGVSIDADAGSTPPTTPVQTSPASTTGLSLYVKGPRASPPPSYLIDDDPFANLSGAPSEAVIRLTSSGGASGSSSAAAMILPPAPPIPSSPLNSDGSGQDLDYFKGKTRSGSLSLPSSPPAVTVGFSHLPPPPSPYATQSQQQRPSLSQRVTGGRGQPRPATLRPAFSARPSLPSLNTLANMNIVLSRKPRKGKVGAGLPFEPWDNVDTPPDSAIDSPALLSSSSPLLGTSTNSIPSPLSTGLFAHATATNEAALSNTPSPSPRNLDLQAQSQPPRPVLKPLLPSQILALGSMAHDLEMSMMYDLPVAPATSLSVSPPLSTSRSSSTSTSATSMSTFASTVTSAANPTPPLSGPPQLPPLSLDFITHSSGAHNDGTGTVDENGEGMKSPLELEFEAAVSPLSAGDLFGVGGGDQVTVEKRWEGEAWEEGGRRQSVIAVGSVSDHTERDDILEEGPALLAIRRQLQEEVHHLTLPQRESEAELEGPFVDADDGPSASRPHLFSQMQQTHTEMDIPPQPESTTSYDYGYGYGYTSQSLATFGSPVPQDSYHSSFSYSSNPDSPPPSDWSRSRSLSSTSMSSIDEELDLNFSELKRVSDASEEPERPGMVEDHQNFNSFSALQYSPDVSIRSSAISSNQFNYGVYKEEQEHNNQHSPNPLQDEHHFGLNLESFFSRTRSSSLTPSIGSLSVQLSSVRSTQPPELLSPSDECGLDGSTGEIFLNSRFPHARQSLLHSDVPANDGGRNVAGEERIESCAEWDAGNFTRAETDVRMGVDEGLRTITEKGSGTVDMTNTAEGGTGVEEGLEVVEDDPAVSIGGRRSASSWLLRDEEGLALLQVRQESEGGSVSLNLERGLMFGIGMNARGGADITREDNKGNSHNMLDVHANKLNHSHEGVLLSVSLTPTISSNSSTVPNSDTSITSESHDITIISSTALQNQNFTLQHQSWSSSELTQSRPSATFADNNTQPIPVLGLNASESQDHHPETAVDGASDSNINQLQLQPSDQDSLHLAPYPLRSSSLTTFSSPRSQSQSPSPSASFISSNFHLQHFSASSSASASPRSSISFREGDFPHPSPDFSEEEQMTRGTLFEQLSDGAEGYSYGNGSGGGQGGYSSSSRVSNSTGYYQSSTSRTAYRGYASTGYPGSGGGGAGGSGGEDREDEERRRRRKLEEMGYISRSSSRRYKESTSGEEDEETRSFGLSRRAPPVPIHPKSSVTSSSMQRYPSTGVPTRFPVTSSSSRSVSDYDSDSSDDDVPLAQRIPGALKAQKTIRKQVKEERERRKQQRPEGRRDTDAHDEYRLRQDTLRPAAAGLARGYAMGGGLSGSQEAAFLATSSVAASSGQAYHLREHPGRRQRTMTLPSKAADSTAPSAFNADDLVRKLQHVQMVERSSPVAGNLSQAMQSRSKSISRTSGDLGDSGVVSSSPIEVLASRSRSIRHPPQQAPASPLALSPPGTTSALPTIRPMRSFRRPSTTDSARPAIPLQTDYANWITPEVGPVPRRSLSQSRGTAERTYVRDEIVPPVPPLSSRSPARTSVDEHAHALQQQHGRKLVKPHQPGSLSRRPSIDIDGRSTQPPLPLNTSVLSPQSAVQHQAPALSSARSAGPVGTLMRFFVFNLQQFNMVHVGPGTSAGDVIDMLQSEGALTGWAGVGGWMVWEVAQDFGMERPVRSFELISEVQASWLKEKTVNYFLLRLTPLAVPLSRHAIPTSSPTHSGYVEWEVKRGKWSKRWMMLKEHSLWMSKRDNGRDEILICSLSNFDAYQITRNHRAPKPFAFAVKSTDNLSFFEDASDYMHSFSCQEKDGVIWLEKILVARSYVLHQERNVLFNPKSANGNGASVSRSATRARKMSTAAHRSPSSPNAPLVAMPPLQVVLSHTATSRNDVFEPGSLLAKHP